jgi:hypothetical protein
MCQLHSASFTSRCTTTVGGDAVEFTPVALVPALRLAFEVHNMCWSVLREKHTVALFKPLLCLLQVGERSH